jgi:hypothetical protein
MIQSQKKKNLHCNVRPGNHWPVNVCVCVCGAGKVTDCMFGKGALCLKNVYQISLSVCFTGAESWPPGVCLKYIGGDQFGHINMVMVRCLDPQEISDVSVQMHSPVSPGMYQGQWRMCTATGLFYGGRSQTARMHCFVDMFFFPIRV